MTLPEQQVRYVYQGPYSVGSTAPVPFTYDESEHVVALRDTTPLELNVEYSVSGQNITLMTPIAASETLVVYRDTPLDNDAEFPQEAEFDSAKINDAIDKLTMQNQEQEDELGRALKLPYNTPTEIQNLWLPIPEANKGLKWNEDATALINTKYDTDELADIAYEQAGIATEQATIATQKAKEAAASALEAKGYADETKTISDEAIEEITAKVSEALQETESIKDAAEQAILEAKDSAITDVNNAADSAVASVTDDINTAKEAAIAEVEASGDETVALAQSWAVGDIDTRPEGSAKWWAEQAKQEIEGDAYTKLEVDALLLQKEDVFTTDNTLSFTEARVLGVDKTSVLEGIPNETEMQAAITAGLSTKQDVLIAGSGITIAEDGKTISADISTVDAYTKAETNDLLDDKQNKLTAGANVTISENDVISVTIPPMTDAYTKAQTDELLEGKQDVLTAGNGIEISAGNVISANVDTYTKSEIQGLLNNKQNTLTAGSYIEISGSTISATPEDMIQTFTETAWNQLSQEEKNAIKVAFIYE